MLNHRLFSWKTDVRANLKCENLIFTQIQYMITVIVTIVLIQFDLENFNMSELSFGIFLMESQKSNLKYRSETGAKM